MHYWAQYIKDRWQGKADKDQKRSSQWSKLRKRLMEEYPDEYGTCAVCGLKKNIELHHKIPFSVDPSLELDPKNLIPLCENKKYGINCHQLIGHLGNYRRFNPQVSIDAAYWNMKLKGDKNMYRQTPDFDDSWK